jgi:hypothetical protein
MQASEGTLHQLTFSGAGRKSFRAGGRYKVVAFGLRKLVSAFGPSHRRKAGIAALHIGALFKTGPLAWAVTSLTRNCDLS